MAEETAVATEPQQAPEASVQKDAPKSDMVSDWQKPDTPVQEKEQPLSVQENGTSQKKEDGYFIDLNENIRYRTKEDVEKGLVEKEKYIGELYERGKRQEQKIDKIQQQFSQYYEFDADGNIVGVKPSPQEESNKLVEAAITGDPEAFKKTLEKTKADAVKEAISTVKTEQWIQNERDSLLKEYPELNDAGSPLVKEANKIIAEGTIPYTINNARTIIRLARASLIEAGLPQYTQKVRDDAHRTVLNNNANGSESPSKLPMQQAEGDGNPFSEDQMVVLKKLGRDPKRAAEVWKRNSAKGGSII